MNMLFGLGSDHAKMCLMLYANNKGADQPAHPRSLISTFVVRCLDIIIHLVSISWSQNPEDRYSREVARIILPLSHGVGDT